jgi:hypothetical protein
MGEPAPLQIGQIARLLNSSAIAIETEVRASPPEVLAWHPAPGEWCIKEVLGHLIEAEGRGFAGRVRALIDDSPDLVAWDQQEVTHARCDCERDAEELLRDLQSQREQGLHLLDSITAADLSRAGRHSKVGMLSIGDVINEWVHHDRNHLKQMLANVQAYVWPHMGAAQGFQGE